MAKSYYKQRGVSTLLISTVFLLVMGVMALTVNRSTLAENKMANNEYKSIQAQQSAQAGVELFIAQLKNAVIATSSIADRNDTNNFEIGSKTVSGTAITQLAVAGTGNLNYKVFAVKDTTTDPAKPVIYVTSYGYADCDENGANCQSNVKLNSRMEYQQSAGTGKTPSIVSVNGNVTAKDGAELKVYRGTHWNLAKYTDEAINYGGQINGVDSIKNINGNDVVDSSCKVCGPPDGSQPETDRIGPKDVGTLSGDKYFDQFFGDTKANIKADSNTIKITPSQLKNVTIPPRGAADAHGNKPKPPVIWVTGDVTGGDFGNFWNYSANKDVIVIIDGNLTTTTENHGASVGFLYTTGNVTAASGAYDFFAAMAVEGSLTSKTSFAVRPQKDPNDLLKSFSKAASLNLVNGNWSDF